MSPDRSALFPNLQDLFSRLHDEREDCVPASAFVKPSAGKGGAAVFPGLAEMVVALQTCPPPEPPASHDGEELLHHGLFGLQRISDHGDEVIERAHDPLEDWTEADWEKRGRSLTVGGVALIGLAVIGASWLARGWARWITAGGMSDTWGISLMLVKSWVMSWVVVGLVLLGVGSLGRRRWAVPLTHAGGWMVAMGSLMALGVASAGFFMITPASGKWDRDTLSALGTGLIMFGIFLVIIPLLVIAIYQRRHLPVLCWRTDDRTRWTDGLQEPLLMLWQACLAVGAVVASLFLLQGTFPLFGSMVPGTMGLVCIATGSGGCLLAAWLLARQWRAGWWLAGILFAVLCASGLWTFVALPWNEICTAWGRSEHSAGDAQSGKLAALSVVAAFVPLSMFWLMSRNCFPVPDDDSSHE